MARTGQSRARSAAQAFVDHLNGVINTTVSDARLSVVPLPYDEAAFEVTRIVAGEPTPLSLLGSSLRLFMSQTITVTDGHCRTEGHSYRVQTDDTPASWLIRWEYHRSPPRPDYEYPLAHLHVNATLEDGSPLQRLHLPTRRVPLELVIWHLVAEWNVVPRTDDWQGILSESIEGFERRQTAR